MNLLANLPILLSLLLAQSAPEPFRLTKVGVILLGTTDMARSVEFYRDRLGLKSSGTNEDFTFFDAGSVTLALRGDLPKGVKATGPVEVVFSVEHVRTAYDALKTRGVVFQISPRAITGTNWAANFQDPDGHQLSIFGPE